MLGLSMIPHRPVDSGRSQSRECRERIYTSMVTTWVPQRTQHPSGESSNAWGSFRGQLHTEEGEVRKEAGKHWPAVSPRGTGAHKGHSRVPWLLSPSGSCHFPVEDHSRCVTWQVPAFPELVMSLLKGRGCS